MAPSTRKYATSLNDKPSLPLVTTARTAKASRIGPKSIQVSRPRAARNPLVCGAAIRNLPSRSGDGASRRRRGAGPPGRSRGKARSVTGRKEETPGPAGSPAAAAREEEAQIDPVL